MSYDAVVLAGGSGRRLGGADKPALEVGGRSMLDTVLTACSGAGRTVVVGPRRAVARPVTWTREDPPGGGPAAALAAGLAEVTAEVVVVLAADLPFLDVPTVEQLAGAVAGDGAVGVDAHGRDQLLCSAWRTAALRKALAGRELQDASLRSVLSGLDPVRVSWQTSRGRPGPWTDCDTPEQLAWARETA